MRDDGRDSPGSYTTYSSIIDALALCTFQALRLDGNLLEDINGLLTTQHELQWLNVSNNRLFWFDYAFVPESLLWLNLRDNRVEEMSNYFGKSGFGMVHLDLGGNLFERIDRQSLVSSLREVRKEGRKGSKLACIWHRVPPYFGRFAARGCCCEIEKSAFPPSLLTLLPQFLLSSLSLLPLSPNET